MSSKVSAYANTLIVAFLTVPLLCSATWTSPNGTPPANNAAEPINVGAVDQFKQGTLGARTLNIFGTSQYLSFGNSVGSAMPGIRFNTGTSQLEFSNGSGTWSAIGASAASSPWTVNGSDLTYLSGNVGVGTTAPFAKIDAAGGTEAIYSRSSPTGAYTFLGNAGSYGRIGAYSSSTGWQNLVLAEGGNVGVGTTAPAAKLDVDQTSGSVSGSALTLHAAASPTGSAYGIQLKNNQQNAFFWGIEHAYDGSFRIGRSGDSASGTYPLFIAKLGNVGIGTTNPGQKLSVAGTIESTSGGIKFPDGTTQTTAAGGGMSSADYDSGWVSLAGGATTTLTHNLNLQLFKNVMMYGSCGSDTSKPTFYGGVSSSGTGAYGFSVQFATATTAVITANSNGGAFSYVSGCAASQYFRLLLWK